LVARSSDGAEWTLSPSIPGIAVDLASGNGVLVGVGITDVFGKILTSEDDGLNWANQSSPASGDTRLTAAAFGNGRFVATGSGQYYVSPDGTNWTASGQLSQNCLGLCSAQHGFVGVGGDVLYP